MNIVLRLFNIRNNVSHVIKGFVEVFEKKTASAMGGRWYFFNFRRMEMRDKVDKKSLLQIILIIFSMFFIIILGLFNFEIIIDCIISSYMITAIATAVIVTITIWILFKYSIFYTNKTETSCSYKIFSSFAVNILFSVPAALLFSSNKLMNGNIIQIASILFFIILLIILYSVVKINDENKNGILYLKVTNLIAASLFTIFKIFIDKDNLHIIEFYYLLQNLLLQCLYGLFDIKIIGSCRNLVLQKQPQKNDE